MGGHAVGAAEEEATSLRRRLVVDLIRYDAALCLVQPYQTRQTGGPGKHVSS
jgi:hypothetical protein